MGWGESQSDPLSLVPSRASRIAPPPCWTGALLAAKWRRLSFRLSEAPRRTGNYHHCPEHVIIVILAFTVAGVDYYGMHTLMQGWANSALSGICLPQMLSRAHV